MLRWFPWRWIVSRVARARGLVDPVRILSRLESFAQPMEVKEPLELLRAGMVFHARGLLNTAAIQHNLDWVWPYWVERQYDPLDVSFIPRAFSITHVNLTHRNWTAVGLPDVDRLPLVDPRGLVTPFWDGWSLDAWVLGDDESELLPSRLAGPGPGDEVAQELVLGDGAGDATPAVLTRAARQGLRLASRVEAWRRDGRPRLRLVHEAQSAAGGWLVVSLRPYNPEGVSFLHRIALVPGRPGCAECRGWTVDGGRVELEETPDAHRLSSYRRGDVYRHLRRAAPDADGDVTCKVGMATAAALYRLEPGAARRVEVGVPMERPRGMPLPAALKPASKPAAGPGPAWSTALAGTAALQVPDPRLRFLYDAAVRTLVLHSPGDVYPGPYTYKRFWFRDAAFILAGMLAAGLTARVERTLDGFPGRQNRKGHFFSQEGEWDSNGEALWILERYCAHAGRAPKPEWRRAVEKGARWIAKKRVGSSGNPHDGLLPAGFSAEHLGPNDYYYWDDFWGVAGLRSAATLLERYGDGEAAARYRGEADELMAAIDASLESTAARLGRPAMPASPYRRLDAGAIGSLAAGYPLQLVAPDDPRLLDTVAFLRRHCFVRGGFFQDMIHSGVNPYLTLHVAQVLLRAGDPAAAELMATVGELASPTGQWPEAIHPRTGGGCMGDGQHVWAAAEWVLALRNAFVREEGDGLVLAGGLPQSWLAAGEEVSFGPTPTAHGDVTVTARRTAAGVEVGWSGVWRRGEPPLGVALPGRPAVRPPAGAGRAVVAHGETAGAAVETAGEVPV